MTAPIGRDEDEIRCLDAYRPRVVRHVRRPVVGARARAGLSQPSGQLRCAVCSRRRHRHSGPAGRSKAVRSLRQAVRDREPARRRHGDGGGPGREEHARRLHHHDGDQRDAGDKSHPVQEAAVRSGEGSDFGGAHLQRAVRAGGEPVAPGSFGCRPRQAREGAAVELRLRRRGRIPSPDGRAVQDRDGRSR